jgi:hypothetical protein
MKLVLLDLHKINSLRLNCWCLPAYKNITEFEILVKFSVMGNPYMSSLHPSPRKRGHRVAWYPTGLGVL